MFVILTYDVNARRDNKVMKKCRKFLRHVQNSVFEGEISYSKLNELKKQLLKVIVKEVDSVCIYEFESIKYAKKEQIGMSVVSENII